MVIVAILVFCSLVHLSFSRQNDKTGKTLQKREQEAVLTARDLISMDINVRTRVQNNNYEDTKLGFKTAERT